MAMSTEHRSSPAGAYPYLPLALRSPRMSANNIIPRVAAFGVAFITACGFLYFFSVSYGATSHTRLGEYLHHSAAKDRTGFARLYDAIRHPVGAATYTDAYGTIFDIQDDGPYWTKPLKNNVLIVDIDTRVPQGPNELWNNGSMNWETLKNEGDGGMISASQMNHFLYSQIHDYDYRFFQANDMDGLHNTWVKPHILLELLRSYQFVIFIDADATIQHLEVPFEWMFNRWGITPETSIAMPVDVRMVGVEEIEQNTGLIVAQALPLTVEMLTAWKDCPTETRYPGCGRWKEEWAHEQRAFSMYIRHDFNPDGNNIVEIPCDDAMGFPGLGDVGYIADNCTGQFVRHHTIAKGMTKRSVEIAMLQSITDLARGELLGNREKYLVKEKEVKKVEEEKEMADSGEARLIIPRFDRRSYI